MTPQELSMPSRGFCGTLEQAQQVYGNILKVGEMMSKKPVEYFKNREDYFKWLRDKAWIERELANLMEMEFSDNVFEVKVDKAIYY